MATTGLSTTLAPGRYLEVLRQDVERMATAAAGDLTAPVPACPGWTVRNALLHTGMVYLHKVATMRASRAVEYPPAPEPEGDLVPWFNDAARALLAELESRGPDAPSHTWWPGDRTVGFWYRRMAQETAVHRVDVESASGDPAPVPDDVAVDGVDEVLRRFLRLWGSTVEESAGGDVDLSAGADRPISVRTGGRAWRVVLHPDRVDADAAPVEGPADAVVTGEPSEVLLWLWGRRPTTAVRIAGDADLAGVLRARLALATE